MANIAWEKTHAEAKPTTRKLGNLKFVIAGGLILAAVAYLMVSGTAGGARYFMTVDEVVKGDFVGQTVRLTGAVIGDTIQYDDKNLIIDFTIAHVPQDPQDLAKALHDAVHNPEAAHLKIHIENQVKPDLLQHEAQAILTGKMGADGVFYASELLLKCPSRFGEADPAQAIGEVGK